MRRPIHLRLRPFLRRDLRARLTTAVLTVLVLTGLSWLGVSALAKIDSREAHELRVGLGLEQGFEVCGGPEQPACSYEDRAQAQVDHEFHDGRRLRLAVLGELSRRVDLGLTRLSEAERWIESAPVSPHGVLQGDTVALRIALTQAVVDLRPIPIASASSRRDALLWPLDALAPCELTGLEQAHAGALRPTTQGWSACDHVAEHWRWHGTRGDMRSTLLELIGIERALLVATTERIDLLVARDRPSPREHVDRTTSRLELVNDLIPNASALEGDDTHRMEVATWLSVRAPNQDDTSATADLDVRVNGVERSTAASGLELVDAELAGIARTRTEDLAQAVLDLEAAVWHGGFTHPDVAETTIRKPTERYRSPMSAALSWQIIGTTLFLLATIMLVVVGPVVTATTTAREREAGTLPVLRMTGMSAGDLVLAMTIGPNVYSLVAGGGLLALALPVLAFTTGLAVTLPALAVLLAMAAIMHVTAIGLGDALGQRVNALVVGGLLALAMLGPGLVGTVMVVGDLAATGFLFGPLPIVLAHALALSGLPFAAGAAQGGSGALGPTLMGYAIAVQGLLGLLSLMSWRRRVEQAWTPLFRPIEGALLALASVGCSALVVLDLSERVDVQTYDEVNLITFVATAFLMPVLGWLLVSSLVRPARAAAVASVAEVRRGFLRFQAFVLLTAVALAAAYGTVLQRTGLGSEQSEIMWATISQCLLVAETIVATLLWSSRKREHRHRILILGAAVVLLQIASAVGIYNLEVEHVALTQTAGNPFLLGMEVSPYWLAFLVVLWAAGFGLVLAALLRERDRTRARDSGTAGAEDNDETENEKPNRWIH